MKTANLKFAKRNVASVLLTMSFLMSITVAMDVMSTPFNVAVSIQEFLTSTMIPDYAGRCTSPFEGTVTGTGTSSLLGSVSVEASDCVTPSLTQNSFAFANGKMIITDASSGDEIFANYHGLLTPTAIPSIFTFTDSVFKITGGTGDFLHAKGGGKLLGSEDISTGKGLILATGKISHFKKDRDDDDRDDRKKNRDHNEKDEDRAENSKADRRIAGSADSLALTGGSSNTTMIAGLDSGLFPNRQSSGQTIGEHFYQDESGQLFAINALPEVGSLSLLGIGLVSLLVMRRRKLANSTH